MTAFPLNRRTSERRRGLHLLPGEKEKKPEGLKVFEQDAGLEQTGAAGRPLVHGLERVCGRLRRPQSRRRVAVKAEVPWAAKVLRGLEPSRRDQSGTRA